MKPKIFNLKFKRVNNEKYIIDRLIESYDNLPGAIKFGVKAYFNDAFALVYGNYMVSLFKFKFKIIKETNGLYVYELPFNLPYYIDDDGIRVYEGDYDNETESN